MLDDYEKDHQTGMNTEEIAVLIRENTNGYPFLVSRMCQLIDVDVRQKMSPAKAWTEIGISEARKLLLNESNTLFQSLTGKLVNYPNLNASIRSILMEGESLPYIWTISIRVQCPGYEIIVENYGASFGIEVYHEMKYTTAEALPEHVLGVAHVADSEAGIGKEMLGDSFER